MIFENDKLILPKYRVVLCDEEHRTDDLEWYQEFAKMHKKEIIVEELNYTEEQEDRLEFVLENDIKDDLKVIEDYVMDGLVVEGGKISKLKQIEILQETVEMQAEIIADLLGGAYA